MYCFKDELLTGVGRGYLFSLPLLDARFWSGYGLLTLFGFSFGSKGLCSMLFRGIDTIEARVVWPFAVATYVGTGAMAFLAKPSSVESPGILRNCLV